MASSLRYFPQLSSLTGGTAAAAPTPSLLRRFSPNFCTFASLRPVRPLSATRKPPTSADQEQEQERFAAAPCRGADEAPSVPNTEAKDPLAAPALRVGIVGFGNFGQFIARGIQRQGHAVLASSRSDYSAYCSANGIRFFRSLEALCEEQPDVLLVCSSILSTEAVVRAIPFGKLRPDTIVADVLSVKQFPRNLLLEEFAVVEIFSQALLPNMRGTKTSKQGFAPETLILPPEFGIICTHPMFGPESGKHGWNTLPFVYDKVRIAEEGDQKAKCEQFLSIFEREGCRMEEMSCAEHDRHAAGSQFITHTIGRVLAQLNLKSTPINTKGYESLLRLTENTVSDSFDLYYGLFLYNVNATEQMDKLDRAFEQVKHMLYGRVHEILRKHIVERIPVPGAPSMRPSEVAREEKNQASRVAAVPSHCHTLPSVAFSTTNC